MTLRAQSLYTHTPKIIPKFVYTKCMYFLGWFEFWGIPKPLMNYTSKKIPAMRVCTDPQKLDRKNLTFGVSTKAFLLYKEYQIVWGFYLSLYFFTILFVILLLCSWNIYSEYVILEGIILFSVYDIRASRFDCCTVFINCKGVGLSFVAISFVTWNGKGNFISTLVYSTVFAI